MYQKLTKTKNLLTVATLLVFCAFTNKVMAWEGNGTASNPWKIGDTKTNTATAVIAVLSGNTLIISGTGNMADFWVSTEGEAPWHKDYYSNYLSITTVSIQNGVTNIGNRAFKDLSGLQTITTIPSSVTNINEQAFLNCTSLKEVEIPNTVMIIRGEAFRNCSSLRIIRILNGINELSFYGYCYWSFDNSITREDEVWCSSWIRKYFSGCTSLQELHLGRNIRASTYDYQSDDFFYGKSSIQTLIIGSTVSSLSNPLAKFEKWSGLKSVTLEDGASNLSFGDSPQFRDCPIIQTFHWGRNIVDINYWDRSPLYEKNTVTTVTIGNNVSSIGDYAFYNCTGLKTITSQRQIPPTAGNLAFYGVNKNTCTVNVPQGTKCDYKKASQWLDFENILDGTNTICETSIYIVVANQLQIFPNPVKDEIFIKSDLLIEKVEICSLTGTLLILKNNFSEKVSISSLSQGMFLLKVYTDKGLIVSKIVKK